MISFGLKTKLAKSEDVKELSNQVITISEQRETLENEIASFDVQIKFLENQVTETEADISKNEERLKDINKELNREKENLSEYLRTIYEEDQISFLELLVKAKSFSEFVDKREYLNTVREEFKTSVDRISFLRQEQKKKIKELRELKAKHLSAKDGIDQQKQEKARYLDQTIEEEIRLRKILSERLAKAGVAPYCKGNGNTIPAAKEAKFVFPVDCGYISQGFGMTEFAAIDKAYRGNIHNGVDIGVGTGTFIKSIGAGKVFAIGESPSGGWGNWVMVKHADDYYSLYAHMASRAYVDLDQQVEAGSVVGAVGGTPYWPPHLHFSLFLGSPSGWGNSHPGPYPGNTIDPLDFMDIPISTSGTDWDPRYYH